MEPEVAIKFEPVWLQEDTEEHKDLETEMDPMCVVKVESQPDRGVVPLSKNNEEPKPEPAEEDVLMELESVFVKMEPVSDEDESLEKELELKSELTVEEHDVDTGEGNQSPASTFVSCQEDNRFEINSEERSYKCNVCSEVFQNVNDIARHTRTYCGKRPHKCTICCKMIQESYVEKHMKIHAGELVYNCSECGKQFPVKYRLLKHLKTHFNDHQQLKKCEICDKFIKLGSFIWHMRTHSNERPFKCDVCQKMFRERSELVRHAKIHIGERPYMCHICFNVYTDIGNLGTHIKTHSGARPHKCDICGKTFIRSGTLATHMATHSMDRPHTCTVCKKSFKTSNVLHLHMRVHTGERNFKCNICGKLFMRSSAMTEHVRTHTGERPFQCSVCGKEFVQSSGLTKHIKTHAEERPYKCEVCGGLFKRSDALATHVKTHRVNRVIPTHPGVQG